jgi:hypothetical protein
LTNESSSKRHPHFFFAGATPTTQAPAHWRQNPLPQETARTVQNPTTRDRLPPCYLPESKCSSPKPHYSAMAWKFSRRPRHRASLRDTGPAKFALPEIRYQFIEFPLFSGREPPRHRRHHRYVPIPETPRKPNPHNHFPLIRTPKPATRSPCPPCLPLQSARTYNQAHPFSPRAPTPTISFRSCSFCPGVPAWHVLRRPEKDRLAKRVHGALAQIGERDFTPTIAKVPHNRRPPALPSRHSRIFLFSVTRSSETTYRIPPPQSRHP